MSTRFLYRSLSSVALLFILSLAPSLFAQSSIVGTVTDPSGSVLPSVVVHITDEKTAQVHEANTNDQGYFVLPALAPSTYTLKVDAKGFSPYTRTGIVLQTDQTSTNNITVTISGVTESVTVESGQTQVNLTSVALSEVVDTRRIVELPLNGRNAASLTLVTAGTVLAPASADEGSSKTFPGSVTISANGARQNQTSFRLDGAPNNDVYTNVNQPFPFPDALQEFSVQTSNSSARFGGNAGGVVNVITKSGGNQIHGSAFEFVRNAVFNGRSYFADKRDQLKRNQYGGTLGGPVTIPGLYSGKDRTFFFGGYQGTRIRNTVNGLTGTVPTVANLNGDFSSLLSASNPNNPLGKVIYIQDTTKSAKCTAATGLDPATGQPSTGCFPGNQIPVGRFDKASVALSKLLPSSTGNGNVTFSQPLSQNFNEYLGRIDHALTHNDQLQIRYYYDQFVNKAYLDPANYLNNTGATTITFQSSGIGETHTFGPNTLNELHINYGREIAVRAPAAGSLNAADLGVNIYQPAGAKILESVSVAGYFSIGQTDPATFARNQYSLNDALTLIRGKHSLAFGGDLLDAQILLRNQFHQPGQFGFTADTNNDAMAAFLTGGLRTFIQGNGEFKDNRLLTYGIFGEDIFHVSRRLTLNIGLRYDPFFPWHETKGRSEVFDSNAYAAGRKSQVYPNAPAGLLFPGDTGVPQYGLASNMKNIAPRVGFAYDLDGKGTTSLRGGFGVFYDSIQNGIYNNRFVDVTPFSVQVNLTAPAGPFSNPYQGIVNPFPAPATPPTNIAFTTPVQVVSYDPANNGVYKTPVLYGYNLTMEHQFAQDVLFRLAYVGSMSRHILETIEKSPAIYSGSLASPDARRYYPQYGSIGQATQDINSNYHSLQATMNKNFSHGFTILANYTFSHSIDDLPFGQSVTTASLANAGGSSLASPVLWFQPGRHAFDRGPSEFDHTNRFVTSFVYQAPKLAKSNTLVRYALGGWQISGIIQAQSGSPLTVLAGKDLSGSALGADRGVYNSALSPYGVSNCGTLAHCKNYMNIAAFSLPAQGTIGSVGKGQFRGPRYTNLDAGLFKETPFFTERLHLQFRAEFFNVFNHNNLFNPGLASTDTSGNGIVAKGVNLSATGAGGVRAGFDPRIGQLALKLLF
jgi:hypothetical protein